MTTEAPRLCAGCMIYHGSVNAERLCLEALVATLRAELKTARERIAILTRRHGSQSTEHGQ